MPWHPKYLLFKHRNASISSPIFTVYSLEKYLFYFIKREKGRFQRVPISPLVLEVGGFAICGHVFPPTNRELAGLPVVSGILSNIQDKYENSAGFMFDLNFKGTLKLIDDYRIKRSSSKRFKNQWAISLNRIFVVLEFYTAIFQKDLFTQMILLVVA